MTAINTMLQLGYAAYRGFNPNPAIASARFKNLEVSNAHQARLTPTVAYSNYNTPIEKNFNRLAGGGRNWGQATPEIQYQVMDKIILHSSHLSPEDQAILLGTARIESGFNPDAAAIQTSASGIFQIVKKTANNLGLEQKDIFDADKNIIAGVKLYEENLVAVKKQFPRLSGDERAIMLYAFHHDGPSLRYGGAAIARKKLLPFLDDFRTLTYAPSSLRLESNRICKSSTPSAKPIGR